MTETYDQRVTFEKNVPFELQKGLVATEISHFGPDFKIQMQVKVNALPNLQQQQANIFSITKICKSSIFLLLLRAEKAGIDNITRKARTNN